MSLRSWWIRLHTCSYPGCQWRAWSGVRWNDKPWRFACDHPDHIRDLLEENR